MRITGRALVKHYISVAGMPEHTVMSVLLLSQGCKAVELVVAGTGRLEPLCVAAAFVQVGVFTLLFGNGFCDFGEAIADHFDRVNCVDIVEMSKSSRPEISLYSSVVGVWGRR
jgi:hypothetical protein